MPKLKKNHFTGLSNIFGEKGKNLSDLLNAKPDHETFDAVDPIATANAVNDTDAIALVNEIKAKVNEILAALQTPDAG